MHTQPNDYLWQEIALIQQDVYNTFDPAVQTLTLYLQVWLAAAAVFSVLALVFILFHARHNHSGPEARKDHGLEPGPGQANVAGRYRHFSSWPGISAPAGTCPTGGGPGKLGCAV